MAVPQPSAVKFYAPDHPALANTLRRQLQQVRQNLLEDFVIQLEPRMDDIRRGKILMLDEVLGMCEDFERELNGEKQ